MFGSKRDATAAAVLALFLAAWAIAAPPMAHADECTDPQGATTLVVGAPIEDSLAGSTSVDVYVFEVAEEDAWVSVSVVDPYQRLVPYLDSSCALDTGGGGRHIDGEGWDYAAGAWVYAFDVGEHTGDYYVTITPDPATVTYPAQYVVGAEVEN